MKSSLKQKISRTSEKPLVAPVGQTAVSSGKFAVKVKEPGMQTRVITLNDAVTQDIEVDSNSQFVLDFFDYSKDEEYTLNFIFNKEGIDAQVLGIYKVPEGGFLNLTTTAIHKVPNTKCITSIRGVLFDGAGSNYIGKIIIEKNAQQTNSYLDDKVLVTGDNTTNSSQPILQIDADDVKASHGATTGRVDEEEVYYLMSRGLSRDEAVALITQGFFESLISTIKDEKIRSTIAKKILANNLNK